MNRYQRQVELELLEHEEETNAQLEKLYKEALEEAKKRLSDWQHNKNARRIRHEKYQQILIAQLEDILVRLRKEDARSVEECLRKMYEDAYLGNLFTMHRDGVELVLRPDEERIRLVLEKKTEELKFSDRIYKNAEKLKEDWRREMCRGLISGRDYKSIAVQLALYGDAGLKRAYTIVRTEGHRVQSESRMDCMRDAASKGADVVKQWDSTVDSRTRGTHRELDGQVKELEEPFVIPSSGRKAMYPGGFGVPAEDINCRCTLLQRARWALDGEEYKYSKFSKQIISTQSKEYASWKKEYADILKQQVQGAKLNKGELYALYSYMSSKSYVINDQLRRGGALSEADNRFLQQLDSALDKMPNYRGRLNRSLYFYDKDNLEEFLQDYEVGSIKEFSEYLSTTKGGIYNDEGQIQIYINNCTAGKDISYFNEQEQEVIYKRGSKFLITDIIKSEDKYLVVMEEA